MHEAISANPLIQFNFLAKESGDLDFLWHEDGGEVYKTVRRIKVN